MKRQMKEQLRLLLARALRLPLADRQAAKRPEPQHAPE